MWKAWFSLPLEWVNFDAQNYWFITRCNFLKNVYLDVTAHTKQDALSSCSSFNFWLIIMSLAQLGKNARHVKIPTTVLLWSVTTMYCTDTDYTQPSQPFCRLKWIPTQNTEKILSTHRHSKTFSITVSFYEHRLGYSFSYCLTFLSLPYMCLSAEYS